MNWDIHESLKLDTDEDARAFLLKGIPQTIEEKPELALYDLYRKQGMTIIDAVERVLKDALGLSN